MINHNKILLKNINKRLKSQNTPNKGYVYHVELKIFAFGG